MSDNPQKRQKEKLEAQPELCIIIDQPMVRDFSTGGGHLPGDTIVEGDLKIVTRKWQGYPPQNLNLIGKPRPAMPEVAIPRYIGKAEYATRIALPNMVHAKPLTNPHPRARVKKLDSSKAEKMPGVVYIMTRQNSPKTYPLPEELFFQGEFVAIVAAETEDQAEDALAAVEVEYEILPFAANLAQAMAPNPPDLSSRERGNIVQTLYQWGDVDKAFAQADVVKEFSYSYAGAIPFPLQPLGGIAKWDGDKVTVWGMGQGVHPQRANIAKRLGIPVENVRYINKWNGGTFGGALSAGDKFFPWIAHIAKMAGRPTKLILQKDQELAQLNVKPANLTKFKVGATKEGKIIACQREFHVNTGANTANPGSPAAAPNSAGGGGRSELYLHVIPNWKEIGFLYRTNSITTGASRSNSQQEFKWAWEQMMDEMAEAVGMDPVQFRLLNVQKPGTKVALIQGGPTVHDMPEIENGTLTYDSYASVEVLQEGAKTMGWEKRNPVAGGDPGRFKRGFGMAMSMHHAGRVGYQEGEGGYDWVVSHDRDATGTNTGAYPYGGELELNAEGHIVLHFAQPDSGTNHSSAMSIQVSEILGYTSLDHIRLIWGDSDVTLPAPGWNSGLTTQLQGGALNNAADKLRKELLKRAALALKVDSSELQMRDGVISSTEDPKKKITFVDLVKAHKGSLIMTGKCVHPGGIGRAMNRGVGACFAEVEVDTWTGDWRYVRAVYCHDAGKVMNPLLASADMHGSLIQSTAIATDAIPWDREFPGTRHYSVGYLSYRLPTIMDVPEQTNVFINSLEPRWYFGAKGFAETAIGAPPGALANAIYNACGVRIREHPVSKDQILAGLRAKGAIV
jgi:xanthine dehydrogenase YagR molybdenum-binding subunit